MSHSEARVRGLARVPALHRVIALSEALRVCSPEEAERFGLMLTELASMSVPGSTPLVGRLTRLWRRLAGAGSPVEVRRAALTEIARRWTRLPSQVREVALAAGRDRWGGAIEPVAVDPDPNARAGLLTLVRACGDRSLAWVVVGLLDDEIPEVAERAEKALLGLARDAAGTKARDHDLETALTDAARRFEAHRRRGAILAGLALLDVDPGAEKLRSMLTGPEGAAAKAARGVLRHAPGATTRRLAWKLLTEPSWQAAAVDRLSRAERGGEHEAVLELTHLGLHPARREALRTVASKAAQHRPATSVTLPDPLRLHELPITSRRQLPRLIGLSRAPLQSARPVTEELLADDDALTRLSTLGVVRDRDLPDFTFDEDAAVARSAALRWSGVTDRSGPKTREGDAARSRLYGILRRSPHESVRTLAHQETERRNPLLGSGPAGRVAALAKLRDDRAAFLSEVRTALVSAASDERERVARLAGAIGVAHAVERELLILLQGDDARAAATAASALATVSGARVSERLEGVLDHEDQRVRANAVESLGTRGSVPDSIAELKLDGHHRVRANAIQASLGRRRTGAPAFPQDAVGALLTMLGDHRPMHRLAALWLSERAATGTGRARLGEAWSELTGSVARLAVGETDAAVRDRARRCARRLEADLRDDWRRRLDDGIEGEPADVGDAPAPELEGERVA
ncbi:MAG: HEAT repeat domain-containing protein [Planctomycetota bacterium]